MMEVINTAFMIQLMIPYLLSKMFILMNGFEALLDYFLQLTMFLGEKLIKR